MIAIHSSQGSFSQRWIEYCQAQNIPYKVVNCYQSDILQQLSDCDALMWHFHQASPKDFLFAKQLLYSVKASGKQVFPDFNTAWHFDDKVGQKYLLEAVGAPLVPSYVFYSKKEALEWADQTSFPKVFKLRGGAGSSNVRMVKTKHDAVKLINKAFGQGFRRYDAWRNLRERFRKWRKGKTDAWDVIKGIARLGYPTEFSRIAGRECGYAYFQDFIPDNDHDLKIIVIGDKAFGVRRFVREKDFRASGSGFFSYKKQDLDEQCVRIAFGVSHRIGSQSIGFDFIYDRQKNPLITEISYGFPVWFVDPCEGYWDRDLTWHAGKFNPQGWMVDLIVKSIEANK